MNNQERIRRALDVLRQGIRLKCEEAWEQKYGHGWLHEVNQKQRRPVPNPTTADIQFLLTGLKTTWLDLFNEEMGRDALSLVYVVSNIRNDWAHQEELLDDDVLRALDSVERLLGAFGATEEHQDIRTLRYDMMRTMLDADDSRAKSGAAVAVYRREPMEGRVFRLEVVDQGVLSGANGPIQEDSRGPMSTAANDVNISVTDVDLNNEIKRRVQKQLDLGKFASVQVFPEHSGSVPDNDDGVRLVVLGPSDAHDSTAHRSAAVSLASRLLGDCGGVPRQNKNMLVFIAVNADKLSQLKSAVRSHLISERTDGDEHAPVSLDSVAHRHGQETASHRIDRLITAAFDLVLTPAQDSPVGSMTWLTTRIDADGRLGTRASDTLAKRDQLVFCYDGTQVRSDIDRCELWSDHGDISVSDLWSHYVQRIDMPRLASLDVLERAIVSGVANDKWRHETYGYQEAPHSDGWVGVRTGVAVNPAPDGLLIHPDFV